MSPVLAGSIPPPRPPASLPRSLYAESAHLVCCVFRVDPAADRDGVVGRVDGAVHAPDGGRRPAVPGLRRRQPGRAGRRGAVQPARAVPGQTPRHAPQVTRCARPNTPRLCPSNAGVVLSGGPPVREDDLHAACSCYSLTSRHNRDEVIARKISPDLIPKLKKQIPDARA